MIDIISAEQAKEQTHNYYRMQRLEDIINGISDMINEASLKGKNSIEWIFSSNPDEQDINFIKDIFQKNGYKVFRLSSVIFSSLEISW